MSPQVAAQLGLEEVWRRQLQVPAGAQSIADQQIYVHDDDPIIYVELRQTGGDASVPADDESRVLLRIPVEQVSENGASRTRKAPCQLRKRKVEPCFVLQLG